MPRAISIASFGQLSRTNSALEADHATVSGGSPTSPTQVVFYTCNCATYINSSSQVRFCRLTSHRPILSYAARAKRKFSCPKVANVWNKLRIMYIEIQFCTFGACQLYCSLAFGAWCSICALQFWRFLFAAGLCRKVFVLTPMSIQTCSCFAYLSSMSTMAVWPEKEYVCGMEDRWKYNDGRKEIITCEKCVATNSFHHRMMLVWPDIQLLLCYGHCHFDFLTVHSVRHSTPLMQSPDPRSS